MSRLILLLTSIWMMAVSALAQQTETAPATSPAGPGPGGQPVPELMYFTLGAGLFIAILMMVWFLRKRSNRAAAERVFNPDCK